MRLIPLRKLEEWGKATGFKGRRRRIVHTHAMVDDEDYEAISKHRWHMTTGYAVSCITAKNSPLGRPIHLLMHRLIMDPGDLQVDHIDGNRLNNCRSNLRVCTSVQNTMNKTVPMSNSTSGVIGVCKKSKIRRWLAHIKINRKQIHLGYFNTMEEAAEARRVAEIKYFGTFAPNREVIHAKAH